MSREKLTELLARVEAATVPDREVDAALGGLEFQFEADEDGRPYVRYASPGGWEPLPAYTTSIDAALALVERVRPDHRWGVSCAAIKDGTYPDGKAKYAEGFKAHLTGRSALRPMPSTGEARTAPLAILSALLRALSRDTP